MDSILAHVDPRIQVGSVIIGNKYSRYGITKQGTTWVVYKILQKMAPLLSLDHQYFDIEIGRLDLDQFQQYLYGDRKGSFRVHSAKFDFIRDDPRFSNKESNLRYKHMLKR
jgi:hypothetical protein